jgi:toxin ParE1/3/4
MAKITFTNGARDDLHQLHEYLSQNSSAYANRLLEKIISRVDVLHNFPQSGRKLPESPNDESLRQLLEGNYRIIYELLSDDRILVLKIHHTAGPLDFGLLS